MNEEKTARLIGGAPSGNTALFHRVQFHAGDPGAFIEKPDGRTILLIRDIEADRARAEARVDELHLAPLVENRNRLPLRVKI